MPDQQSPITEETTTARHVVLYVEDNPANMRLIERVFMRMDHIRLITTIDPQTGLQIARKEQPDLIMLDINLPGMTGTEMMLELRKEPIFADKPILAISADAMQKNIDEALSQGFDHYLTKPVDIRELQKIVESYLQPA